LAIAADDHYQTDENQPLTVSGLGTWQNDTYNPDWETDQWGCKEWVWQDEHWDPEWARKTGHSTFSCPAWAAAGRPQRSAR
jgi:hypothetical protein